MCLEKGNMKTRAFLILLQILGAAIVHLDFKEGFPLAPEFIKKQDVF